MVGAVLRIQINWFLIRCWWHIMWRTDLKNVDKVDKKLDLSGIKGFIFLITDLWTVSVKYFKDPEKDSIHPERKSIFSKTVWNSSSRKAVILVRAIYFFRPNISVTEILPITIITLTFCGHYFSCSTINWWRHSDHLLTCRLRHQVSRSFKCGIAQWSSRRHALVRFPHCISPSVQDYSCQ